MNAAFDKLIKDQEFLLHWRKCWPALRLALIEQQFEMPATSTDAAEVGRRTLYLKETIDSLEKLNVPEVDPSKTGRPKPLNRQHFRPPQT